eukprot:1566734-Amphidinium_carterae.1
MESDKDPVDDRGRWFKSTQVRQGKGMNNMSASYATISHPCSDFLPSLSGILEKPCGGWDTYRVAHVLPVEPVCCNGTQPWGNCIGIAATGLNIGAADN